MADERQAIAQRTRDLLTQQSEAAAGLSVPELIGMQPLVLETLARMVEADSEARNLLRINCSSPPTVTAGSADLTACVAANRLMLDRMRSTEIWLSPDTLGMPFHWLDNRQQLDLKRPGEAMYVSCAREGFILYTRDQTGSRTADLGATEVIANFIPLLDGSDSRLQLPLALKGQFVRLAAGQAIEFWQQRAQPREQQARRRTA